MALRLGTLKAAGSNSVSTLCLRRWVHGMAMAPPLDTPFHQSIPPPPLVLPDPENSNHYSFGFGFPGFSFGGSMELMAVPKKKVSPHKRGIRNGPKALKPTPVIIRCRSCGRVKLPHFFCCSGDREKTGEQNN